MSNFAKSHIILFVYQPAQETCSQNTGGHHGREEHAERSSHRDGRRFTCCRWRDTISFQFHFVYNLAVYLCNLVRRRSKLRQLVRGPTCRRKA